MKLSRRHLAALGALALGAPTLIGSAHAQSADEATVKKAVEELRTALIKQDKAKIESLTAEQLSYSHSDARLQNKAEFIDGVMTRKGTLKSPGTTPSCDTFGSRKASSTARSPTPKSASCRCGRSRKAVGSCWRVRLGGCRRRHSTTLVGIHRSAETFIRGLSMRASADLQVFAGQGRYGA